MPTIGNKIYAKRVVVEVLTGFQVELINLKKI